MQQKSSQHPYRPYIAETQHNINSADKSPTYILSILGKQHVTIYIATSKLRNTENQKKKERKYYIFPKFSL